MASAPSTPSYARSTRASVSRSTPNSPQTPDSPTSSPRKLKRPSTLTGHDRQIALFMSQLRSRGASLTITAADPSKPCPFATLPTELREMIYEYALPDYALKISNREKGPLRNRHLWPALLRVSKCVRYEAAYMFYAHTSFEAKVFDLKFDHFKDWIESLSVEHRHYLTKNQKLTVSLFTNQSSESTLAADQLVWEECRAYGNLFSARHKPHFVALSRLANWFLWCSKPVHTSFQFKYTYPYEPYRAYWSRGDLWWSDGCTWAVAAHDFLKHDVGSFLMPCTQNVRLTRAQKVLMKKEALTMVECLDRDFKEVKKIKVTPHDQLAWDNRLQRVKRHFEKW